MNDTHDVTRTLPEHHRHLSRIFDALVAEAYEGDPIALRREWSAFERELLGHMELEERDLFPAFDREHPNEAARLRADHADIRSALSDLAISLDLHALRADAVRDFVAKLKEHAHREDLLFYPWAAQHPPRQGWHGVRHELEAPVERPSAGR